MTVVRGRRASAARVFLEPAMRRRNLHVETRALASRVRIDSGRAIGVDYVRGGRNFTATAERLIGLFRERSSDPLLHDEVTQAWIDAECYRLYTLQTATRVTDGKAIGAESSLNKIFWSEMDVRMHEIALRLLGPDAEIDGPWMKGFEFALAGPIYAGTNEIQRNVVAERVLGLPRR